MTRPPIRDSLAVEAGNSAASLPERGWAERIRAGDATAFELAFRTYHAPLCTFVYRYVRSRELAQELVQDVFARIWEQRASLEVRDSLKSFLYTAVRNHAISHLRHMIVERRWHDRVSHVSASRDDRRDTNDVEARVEAQELTEAVQRVLARLPERCRLALTLRWQRQMSYAEVAEVMGVSVKTVEIHVTRGLAALREHYQELLPHR
jgi:RNA polymerase sigma-70 factor, ECF subfamily